MDVNAVVCSKLALTRCKTYARDINAVMFMCRDKDNTLDSVGISQIMRLVSILDRELQNSYNLLVIPEDQ